jgi:hypothetical protein
VKEVSVAGSPPSRITVSLTTEDAQVLLDAMEILLEALTAHPPGQADDAPLSPNVLALRRVPEHHAVTRVGEAL